MFHFMGFGWVYDSAGLLVVYRGSHLMLMNQDTLGAAWLILRLHHQNPFDKLPM